MKKIISTLLTLCLVFGALAVCIPANAVTYGYLRGDANDDLDVTMKDILLTRKYVSGSADETEIDCIAADVDTDEDVTLKDVLKMRKYVSGAEDFDGINEDGRYRVDAITIGGRNVQRYTVVVPEDADECMRFGASELVKYINRACGVTLNISEGTGGAYAIRYDYDREDKHELGAEGYYVSVGQDGNVDVICGNARGALYATYYFLEKLVGYRFLVNSIEYLYESENVNIPLGFEDKEVPFFKYRALAQSGCTEKSFAMLRTNALDGAGSQICGQARYGWGLGTLYIHAHSYAYQMAGYEYIYTDEPYKYLNTQPCFSDEETYEKIVDYNLHLLAEREGWGQHLGQLYTQISCSPNDNANFCLCQNCMKIYDAEGCISGAVIRLSNRVADRLNIDYPGIEIFTISYSDNKRAPKMTRPNDNVCICICNGSCGNHPYDHPELCDEAGGNPRLVNKDRKGNPVITSNADDIRGYHEWMEISGNVYSWYYSANFCFDLASSPNWFNVYSDLRFYAECGVDGVYFEGSDGYDYPFDFLRGYMAAKMMWNPFMTEEEFNDLFNEFLMIYFGDGWENIREYLEMANAASDLNGCWTNNFDKPWDMYNKKYYTENYEYMSALFDKALEASDDAQITDHIVRARLQCDFLGLSATYRSLYEKGSSAEKSWYLDRYHWFYDTVCEKDVGITRGTFSGAHGCDNFPASRDDVYDTIVWMCADYDGWWD